ncbi:DNA polymerase III subunit gamma/tau [Chloroflexota bacterium]
MDSQVFYRKWRPQTLAEVVGQEHVTKTLHNALRSGRVAHAYLFCGPRGTGKTSTGRILAKAVNCLTNGRDEPCNSCSLCQAVTEGRAFDVIEIDAASNRGIDEIRDLRERAGFAPNLARYKVYIIDEAHMLTEAASNALLKTLEEPPPHVIFILATTESHKVLPTILSRCQRFDFRRLPQSAVISRLKYVCDQEGIAIQPPALRLIARSASGSMRDAENLLEQLVAYHGSEIELHQVQSSLGIGGSWPTRELAKHIIHKDIPAGLAAINAVANEGLDLRQFNREMVEYLRALLLVKAGSGETVDVTTDDLTEMKSLVAKASLDHILKAVKLFGRIDLRLDNYSPLPLELALVECALPGEGEIPAPQPSAEMAEPTPQEETEGIHVPQPSAEMAGPTPQEETEGIHVPQPSAEMAGPTPQEEAAVPAPTPEGSSEIDRIRNRWDEVVEALRGVGSSGNLDAFLRNACEPVAVEVDTIVLGFYYPFHLEKIDDPKYRHLIEKKMSEVLGSPYQLRCILKTRDKKHTPQGHLIRAAVEMGAKIINVEEK